MPARTMLQPFANRVRKNARHWGRWARRLGIECYRLYDRDLPEFPYVVDRYAHRIQVQELSAADATAQVDEFTLRTFIQTMVGEATGVAAADVVVKARHGQRPEAQYGPMSTTGHDYVVSEGGLRFVVNLERYLDTGLFIDHRDTRQWIRGRAQGKRLLNLFCYTGAFTVYANAGGAAESLSIDMSGPYLDWARRNFELNGLDLIRHRLLQAEALQFLEQSQEQEPFDLVVLDPPSFSNSKRMHGVLDIQRDHVRLIDQCERFLTPEGELLFSTNLRDFRLNESALKKWKLEELNLVPRDFRNRRIHKSWWLRRAAGA